MIPDQHQRLIDIAFDNFPHSFLNLALIFLTVKYDLYNIHCNSMRIYKYGVVIEITLKLWLYELYLMRNASVSLEIVFRRNDDCDSYSGWWCGT